MTALLIIAAVLVLLFIVPIGARVIYNENGVVVNAVVIAFDYNAKPSHAAEMVGVDDDVWRQDDMMFTLPIQRRCVLVNGRKGIHIRNAFHDVKREREQVNGGTSTDLAQRYRD